MLINEVKRAQQGDSSLQIATRNEERFAAIFAMIAGYADAYAYIHYRTYVSFMSGNTTSLGSAVGQSEIAAAVPALVAIVFYVLGAFSGAVLATSGIRRPHRPLFALIAALLVAVVAITQLNAIASVVSIAMLSLAMGLMNTTLSHVGAQSVNLVFVTGTLSRMARHFALAVTHAPLPDAQGSWDTHLRRAFLLMGLWASMLTGALLGGLTASQLGVGVLLFPALILIVLSVYDHVPT